MGFCVQMHFMTEKEHESLSSITRVRWLEVRRSHEGWRDRERERLTAALRAKGYLR